MYISFIVSRRLIFRPVGANIINIAFNPCQYLYTCSYYDRIQKIICVVLYLNYRNFCEITLKKYSKLQKYIEKIHAWRTKANHESFTWKFTATFNIKEIGIPALNLLKWFIIVVHERHLEWVHGLGHILRVFSNTPVNI